MIGLIKENERLVRVSKTELRTPCGALANVPQYMIVPADKANPADFAELLAGERLIQSGTLHTDRESAEARFEALKAGKPAPPMAKGIPLYVKESAENVNPETGLSDGEQRACDMLAGEFLAAFARTMRKMKAAKRQHT